MATNTEYSDKCPMCRYPLIDETTRISIKSCENRTLIQELIRLGDRCYNIQRQNDRLWFGLIILFLLVLGYMILFYLLHWDLVVSFARGICYIVEESVYGWKYIFNILLIYPSIWIWGKIGVYVTSFIILGFFTIIANDGHLPLIN